MRPLVQEEAFHIGSEAIRNACLHADATRIEIELLFDPDLLLRVKDDGKGMSPVVASVGREGHFGLVVMRERASRIGARLLIDTSPGARNCGDSPRFQGDSVRNKRSRQPKRYGQSAPDVP